MRALILAMLLVAGAAHAQPADPKDLYDAATKAMEEARYPDAIRDFTAAYELTQDPVLFFKLGTAHEKAGDCATALTYYKRYLAEAKPEQQFIDLTNERIKACEQPPPTPEPAPPPDPAPAPAPEVTPPTPLPPAPVDVTPSRSKDIAWLFVGGALTFATAGAVLAYSTSSAESDIKDLYVSTGNMPPDFDANTKRRYDDLVAEGERYELLSIISFGLAAGCAAGATLFFWKASNEDKPAVTPVITPTGASVRFAF